jgi:hypothetical protein
VKALVAFTVEELAALMRKEQLNSYGILADSQTEPAAGPGPGSEATAAAAEEEGERRLRGSAIYAKVWP